MNVLRYPLTTEKAVKLIEAENKVMFVVDLKAQKKAIAKEFEELFKVKIDKINVVIKGNKKVAIIKLRKEHPALDVATKLKII